MAHGRWVALLKNLSWDPGAGSYASGYGAMKEERIDVFRHGGFKEPSFLLQTARATSWKKLARSMTDV